jgi:hypothetical protein
LRNAATGNYFYYQLPIRNGIILSKAENPTGKYKFQLLSGRTSEFVGNENVSVEMKGYWIVYSGADSYPCLNASTSGITSASNFSIANAADYQRWMILDGEEIIRCENALTLNGIFNYDPNTIYSVRPENTYCRLTSLDDTDEVSLCNYTQSPSYYPYLQWEIKPIENSDETGNDRHYIFTNVKTRKVLRIGKWMPGTEIATDSGIANTRAVAYNSEDVSQQLKITFVENIISENKIVQLFAVVNDNPVMTEETEDNRLFYLDSFGSTSHRSKVGNSNNSGSTVISGQKWIFVAEKTTTGISSVINDPEFKVYAKDQMLIIDELPSGSMVSVADLTGKIYAASKISGTGYAQQLPKGIYIVSVTTPGQQSRVKVAVN